MLHYIGVHSGKNTLYLVCRRKKEPDVLAGDGSSLHSSLHMILLT
jgi:hypothetical protein